MLPSFSASLHRPLLSLPAGVFIFSPPTPTECLLCEDLMNLHMHSGRIFLSLSLPGPPNNSCVHRGTKCSENSHRRHLRGQLRSLRCSRHCHDRHTTEERGRRVRGLRRLHTSGLPRCAPGAYPRRLPDLLRPEPRHASHQTPLKEHFIIYEERTCRIGARAKPASEEC